MGGVTYGGRGGVLRGYICSGWTAAKMAKQDGTTLASELRSKPTPGKAAAFKQGWLAFEAGLPYPSRKGD